MIAVAALGIGLAIGLGDGLSLVGSHTVSPNGEVSPPVAEAADEPAGAEHDELGATASAPDGRGDKPNRRDEAEEPARADETAEREALAAMIPAGNGDSSPPVPCGDTNSCVDRVGHLLTGVGKLLPDVLIRGCTSLIGGKATCFYFGRGNYLVGDSPADGHAELGFCMDYGNYYYVTGPSLGGGDGAACPEDGGVASETGVGQAPKARECTSSAGGDATCFDFGGGNYIVSDPLADGEGELGFCANDKRYYYVSAPSAEGDVGAKCPGAPTAD